MFLLQGAILGLLGALLGSLSSYGLVAVFNLFAAHLFSIPVDLWLPLLATLLATLTGNFVRRDPLPAGPKR